MRVAGVEVGPDLGHVERDERRVGEQPAADQHRDRVPCAVRQLVRSDRADHADHEPREDPRGQVLAKRRSSTRGEHVDFKTGKKLTTKDIAAADYPRAAAMFAARLRIHRRGRSGSHVA